VGIGILKTNAGIGIPASVIPVRYRTKKCRTASFYSGTGPFTSSLISFSPVPDWQDAGKSGIPTFSVRLNRRKKKSFCGAQFSKHDGSGSATLTSYGFDESGRVLCSTATARDGSGAVYMRLCKIECNSSMFNTLGGAGTARSKPRTPSDYEKSLAAPSDAP
jgi:hypothetical protein